MIVQQNQIKIISDWMEGMFVWAKTDNIFWPSITFDTADCIIQKPKQGQIYVYWFGDKRISMVHKSSLQHFHICFRECYESQKNIMGSKWKEGVCAAIKEFVKPITTQMTDSEAMEFALNGFPGLDLSDPDNLCKDLPQYVKDVLINKKYIEWKRIDRPKNTGNLKNFSSTSEVINSLCVACYSYNPQHEHPLFEAKVCYDCLDKLKNTMNVLDDERLYIFCFICGNSTNMHCCINRNCQRIYCSSCLQYLMNRSNRERYLECNLCTPCSENTLLPKDDWLYEMQLFFNPGIKITELNAIRNIKRVMFILCDHLQGFETLYTHYNKIPFRGVEKGIFGFYSCNDNSCYPDYRIFLDNYDEKDDYTLNDYCNVSMDKINQLGTIDLLVGGVTSNSHDEYIQLKIFFDFFRLLQVYKYISKARLHYWYFEITCLISDDIRKEISKLLNSEPQLIQHSSTDVKYNLIWTNIKFHDL